MQIHLYAHILTSCVQYLLLWAPISPVLAITFFEKRYNNDPLLLQYAHRVLEQHPVDLTFFFVPQVVQALRYDELGKCLLYMALASPKLSTYLKDTWRDSSSRRPRSPSCSVTKLSGT